MPMKTLPLKVEVVEIRGGAWSICELEGLIDLAQILRDCCVERSNMKRLA
jgi:hypothetical protein